MNQKIQEYYASGDYNKKYHQNFFEWYSLVRTFIVVFIRGIRIAERAVSLRVSFREDL
jgi:hypothetical protein